MNLAELVKTAHEKNLDLLSGGKADKVPPSAFPKEKVEEGARVEREHTSNKTLAKEIARDHLAEDPGYYKKLRKMEKKAGSHVHFCKDCGKAHRPKCDQCGSTRDLRSYHGPCGKCAFKKESQVAFLDELQKIAFGMNNIRQGAEGIGKNLAGGAAALVQPRQALKKGWDATWNPGGKPLGVGWKAMMGLGLAMGARDVSKKEDPSGRGHSRVRRALRFAGEQAGGIMGAPYGLTGGLLTSAAVGKVGDLAGAAVDKLRGYRRPNPHLPPAPQGLQR